MHSYSHTITETEPTGPVALDICTCGSVMDRTGCLGGHADLMAFFAEMAR
jgi:hypothetical protein